MSDPTTPEHDPTATDIDNDFRNIRETYERNRRIGLASVLELALLLFALFAYVIFYVYKFADVNSNIPPSSSFVNAILSSAFVGISLILVVDIFQVILSGRAILVSMLLYFSSPREGKGFISALTDAVEGAVGIGAAMSLPDLIRDSAKRGRESNELVLPGSHPSVSDPVERAFDRYIARSERMVETAQRRPNALLFIGVVVAAAGLAVFIFTIPGLFAQNLKTSSTHDFFTTTTELLPKLLMLLFVQVLAGFFLRQYRVSMVELRYYEAVLRYRESQFLSYLIRIKAGADKTILQSIGKELLTFRDFLNLRQGETNMFLETSKLEENEFKGLYERIMDILDKRLPVASTESAKSGASSRRSPKKTPSTPSEK